MSLYRDYIRKTLLIGGVLLFLLAISVSLWGMLAALGDVSGSQALYAITLVIWICWCFDFVTLVVLVALALLSLEPPYHEQDS